MRRAIRILRGVTLAGLCLACLIVLTVPYGPVIGCMLGRTCIVLREPDGSLRLVEEEEQESLDPDLFYPDHPAHLGQMSIIGGTRSTYWGLSIRQYVSLKEYWSGRQSEQERLRAIDMHITHFIRFHDGWVPMGMDEARFRRDLPKGRLVIGPGWHGLRLEPKTISP